MSELNNKDYNEQIYKFLIEEILDKDAIFDLIYYKITGKYPDNDCSSVSKNKIDGYLKQFSENEDKMCAAKKTIEYYNLEYGKSDRICQSNSVLDIIFKSESKCNLNNINSDFYKFLDFLKNLKIDLELVGNQSENSRTLYIPLKFCISRDITEILKAQCAFIEPTTKVKKEFLENILTDERLERELSFNINKIDIDKPYAIFLEDSKKYLSENVFYNYFKISDRNEQKVNDKKYKAKIIDFSALGLFNVDIDSVEELEEFLYIIINLPINLLKYIKLDLNLKEHIFKFSFTTSSDNNCIYIIENSGENSKKIGEFLCKKPIYNREEVIKIINNISKYTI